MGTCGFSYRDWIGPLYPPGTASGDMLRYYARRFAAVEIDATYYRVPNAATFASMAARTPPGFRFAVKLPGTATHLPDPGTDVPADVVRLRTNLAPLVEARKLGCILMQFPNAFHPTATTHAYIGRLRDALDGIALVAEFRHREWQSPETLRLLRELGIGFTNVDEPAFSSLMRPSAEVTNPIAYVRFHGRNAANWWRGTNETRYDYLYAPDELAPWLERLGEIATHDDVREIYAFFNNHRSGNAVRNAEMLQAMIAEHLAGLVDAPEPPPPEPTALSLFDAPAGDADASR